jgi:DnaJ-class molecular chaperone
MIYVKLATNENYKKSDVIYYLKCYNIDIISFDYNILYFTRIMNRIVKILLILIAFMIFVDTKIPNPYKVLGISQDANEDQIKEGFKKRSKKYHPDRNKSDPRAKEKF